MERNRFKVEQIIRMLREADVHLTQETARFLGAICASLGIKAS
ncbi:MAG: hypothetical protein ACLP5H_00495 [Desulfomonilaceae bacterium]